MRAYTTREVADLLGMRARGGNVPVRGVDPDHRGAQPRHRLADQAAAAADVEHPQAGQRGGRKPVTAEMAGEPVTDELEPGGVELV